jgi:hypothetical protein
LVICLFFLRGSMKTNKQIMAGARKSRAPYLQR